jgi:ribosome-interacting GTPase 1
VGAEVTALDVIRREVALAGIERPALIAATKADDASPRALDRFTAAAGGLDVVPVSILDDHSIAVLRERIWTLTGLIRIHLRHDNQIAAHPVALRPPVTVADAADTIHHDIGRNCIGGRVWGPSARFPGQHVGRNHLLSDGDQLAVET